MHFKMYLSIQIQTPIFLSNHFIVKLQITSSMTGNKMICLLSFSYNLWVKAIYRFRLKQNNSIVM